MQSLIFEIGVVRNKIEIEYKNENEWVMIGEESFEVLSWRDYTLSLILKSLWRDGYTKSTTNYPFIEKIVHFIGDEIHLLWYMLTLERTNRKITVID